MPPKKRRKENQGLPKRWRFRAGKYRYLVPKGMEEYWDGKTEFTLGESLSEAYRAFSERVQDETSLTTMAGLIDRYLKEVTPEKNIRTRKDEPYLLKTLREVFGESSPRAIKPSHIYQVYNSLKPRGLHQANKFMGKLSHVFTKAIEWGVIDRHPMTNNKFIKQHPSPPKKYITDEQVKLALESAPALLLEYVNLKMLTGLRMTDLLGLKWSDWDNGELNVEISKTINTTGEVRIYVGDELAQIMDRLKSLTPFHIREYVFVNREGRPYLKPDKSCSAFRERWAVWMRNVEKQHGFRFTERQLRVKVASDQETDKKAAELLGHSSEKTVKKHYRAKPIVINTGKKQ